ncbi:preprotein translocase subunit YajC [Streptobacillus moniliformis]|uniref:Preprotein translocase, YajC subunit n=1 Tax=Streptobacillus moniliformis (strain ATCC 14647 / DSM 12112 / NCTC 10651 / 9901) TaxID=519441 RepID=D1AY12_STRM9|nr:preprotein translocase subunit YajC [Streptobacillus moniliformis]ACZ01188.1 preprotein translocase, YajC subunit [Streptobacillus moniliformis DSM 12112]AVL42454.1 preprotein translocase subunit YajC [Streptobacillus moniliformis]QXW65934.1 preprotein translocase subunit YajC [Streptobacillus moniliformis]SQA13660.1 preprotein translocase subunit YajC [Streptobacillus moniliformis]
MYSTTTILVIYAVIFIPLLGILYYNNNKKRKKFDEMMNSLNIGQKIMTIGGIIGNITKINDETVEIKVDQNTRLTITKRAISHIIK